MARHLQRNRRKVWLVASALAAAGTLATTVPLQSLASVGAAEKTEATLFEIVQEGMTPDSAARLAEKAGIGNALQEDGSFNFVDSARFASVPQTQIGRGEDEHGRPTTSEALDFEALAKIRVLPERKAAEMASHLVELPDGYKAQPIIGHTTLDRADAKGNTIESTKLDTTVTFQLNLAGLPVVGPGAKARVSFGEDGAVVQLTRSVRSVKPAGSVGIIPQDQARKACSALYGTEVGQAPALLSYYSGPLAADRASGKGTAKYLVPHYICQPKGVVDDGNPLGGKLIPAVPELTPHVELKAAGDGRSVAAAMSVDGGTAPYRIQWSSGSAPLTLDGQSQIHYERGARLEGDEHLVVTVIDANGVQASASVVLANGIGEGAATGLPGGLGGVFASNGIEQTVDEWQCAQDSANGFKSSMLNHGQTVPFDWRGASAFEKDFKDTTLNGWDASYVDNVDAQWYTGHGNPNLFTFKSKVDDTAITPADARWGNRDLEWLQLESCQVLRDTNGHNDYFARWGGVFRGLHLLNGFDTNATCINGGTGGRFADYLFPQKFLWWTIRPALRVQQAWASMAGDLEPAGTRWRSMSPATTGWVNNLGDFYWGQGSVGPDIAPGSASHPLIGWVAVSGVS